MIIDMHVHLVGTHEARGCHLSQRVAPNLLRPLMAWHLGFGRLREDSFEALYRERLLEWVAASGLDAVGLLAFDGVYDARGELDRRRTHMLVGNDYCLDVCRRSPKLLPICSVNPRRRDAFEELERVAQAGAVAIKILPNSQDIDPACASLRPFWRQMAHLGLPLLTHASYEHTIPPINQAWGDPRRLRGPLEQGVKVIAAHCAAPGLLHPRARHLEDFLAMLGEFPHLYGDISALGSLSRYGYIERVLAHPLGRARVMLGSDFPVPAQPALFAARLGMKKVGELRGIDNPLDRNFRLFEALGVDEGIMRRASEVLRLG